MNYRIMTNYRTNNGRLSKSKKPIIKPLSNVINIERLLLTGLRSLDRKPIGNSFDCQVRKAYS